MRPVGRIFLQTFLEKPETARSQKASVWLERYNQKRPIGLNWLKTGRLMTKGEQTRRKIVEAAAPIFNKHGYDGSSLHDLMEATGLKKGGIYRHFASKEELAAEAFDYTWEAAWNARLLHVDDKSNGIEKLKQLIAKVNQGVIAQV